MSSQNWFHRVDLRSCAALISAAAVVAAVLPAGADGQTAAASATKSVQRVYTETNDPNSNQVLIFDSSASGKLTRIGTASTGGKGGNQPQPGCMPTCAFLDTQNEVVSTANGLVFAVNAGSNQITSFRVTSSGLKRVSVVSSQGAFPNSLTVHGRVLYTLDIDSLNIAGFRISSSGKLTPIKGSVQKLVGGALPGISRQVQFDNTGRLLMVTLLANQSGPLPAGGTKDTIDTFPVSASGVAGAGKANDSTAPFPFAVAFDKANHPLVAEPHDITPAANGMLASFKVTPSHGISPIQTAATKGTAPCWVVVSANGRYAYVVNTGNGSPTGGTVSVFTVSPSGKLKLIQVTPALKEPSGSAEFDKTDEALSPDGRFLYVVVVPGTFASQSRIDTYKVGSNGKLTLAATTASNLPAGLSGAATGVATVAATTPKPPSTPGTSPSFTG